MGFPDRRERARRRRHQRRLAALIAVVGVAVGATVFLTQQAHPRHVAVHTTPRRPARVHHRVWPSGWTRTAATAHAEVPILMYHVLAAPPASAPYPGLYVPAAEFAAQIHALARAGFHGVTLDEVERAWKHGGALPSKPIVLTFDNGYRTQYTRALPILRRVGWVADENMQLSGLPPAQGGLTHRDVVGLVKAGWELDTQGYSHADLPALDTAQLRFQIAAARRTIQRRFHVRVNWFCYPSGRYDPRVIAEVKAAGYLGSTTVLPGWAKPSDDPYRLPRLRVLGGTSPRSLLTLITGTRNASWQPARY